jgi:hypothetical protein
MASQRPRAWQPDLTWIAPHLAPGGSFPAERAPERARDIRAVVDLRREGCDGEAELTRCGLTFLHLPTSDHGPVSQAMLDDVAFVTRDRGGGEPVLRHGLKGIAYRHLAGAD